MKAPELELDLDLGEEYGPESDLESHGCGEPCSIQLTRTLAEQSCAFQSLGIHWLECGRSCRLWLALDLVVCRTGPSVTNIFASP